VKGRLYKTGIIPSELARRVKEIANRALIIADSASPDIIAEIKAQNCRIKPVKKPKIVERLEILRNYKIIVDPSSTDIVEEFNNYCWDSNYDLGEKPIDDFNHYIDAINYYIVYRSRRKGFNNKSIR
jgi:phage terminase large subunit